jgi:3D (Asp-Asp-Asp) domain-containing protein
MRSRNKGNRLIAPFLIVFICSVCYVAVVQTHNYIENEKQIEQLCKERLSLRNDIVSLESKLYYLNSDYVKVASELDKTKMELAAIKSKQQSTNKTSRGEYTQRTIMRVTAYDLSYESCEKYPSHPEYGITASGVKVKEWHTIAAGSNLPFGTRVYIPYFKDKLNGGIFVVEDRGGAIKNGRIDVYMESNKDCLEFGVQDLEVFILK